MPPNSDRVPTASNRVPGRSGHDWAESRVTASGGGGTKYPPGAGRGHTPVRHSANTPTPNQPRPGTRSAS